MIHDAMKIASIKGEVIYDMITCMYVSKKGYVDCYTGCGLSWLPTSAGDQINGRSSQDLVNIESLQLAWCKCN